MNFTKKIASVAGALIIGYAAYEVYAFIHGTGPSCSEISHEQAIETVSKDFLENLMPRLPNDIAKLGTQAPALQFDRKNIQVTDIYHVPFTATGTAAQKEYFAMYHCKLGRIEYGSK